MLRLSLGFSTSGRLCEHEPTCFPWNCVKGFAVDGIEILGPEDTRCGVPATAHAIENDDT